MDRKLLYGIVAILVIFVTALRTSNAFRHQGNDTYNGLDVWEYQTVAVNFSEHGRFPVMGFVDDESKYDLKTLKSNAADDYIKCRFTEHGPVTYVGKPPLYSLVLGAVYAVFQPNLIYAYYLNLTCFAAILLVLLLVGRSLDQRFGIWIGVAACLLYTCFGNHKFSDVLPAALLTLICCGITLASILLQRKPSAKNYAAMGLLLGVGMLTKGNIIFIVFLIPLCLLYFFHRKPKVNLKLLVLIGSFVLILLPWVIYANYLRVESRGEWKAWKQKIAQAERTCEIDTSEIATWQGKEVEIIRNNEHHQIVSHLYSRTVNADVPIVISNQATSDEMLSVHNEYTVDGDWHPEWRFRKSALYNRKYLDKPYLVKILCFYMDHPSLLFEIALAKTVRTTLSGFSFFLFSAFLFGCLMWSRKMASQQLLLRSVFITASAFLFVVTLLYDFRFHAVYATLFFLSGLALYRRKDMEAVPFIFPVCILNSYLIIWIFYGEARFVNVIEPLTIFASLYFLYLLLNGFFRHNPPEITV